MAKKKKIILTVPQYAQHREVNDGAVRYAIREGKLSRSLIKDGSGSIQIDRDLADQEWQPRANWKKVTNTEDLPKLLKKKNKSKKVKVTKPLEDEDDHEEEESEYQPGREWDPRKPWDISMLIPINVSRMRREAYETDLARIKVEKEMSLLVSAKEVEDEWVKISTLLKTKVLGLPSKARQKMPELTDYQYSILETIAREALEEISENNTDAEED